MTDPRLSRSLSLFSTLCIPSLEDALNSFRNINFDACSAVFTHQTSHSFPLSLLLSASFPGWEHIRDRPQGGVGGHITSHMSSICNAAVEDGGNSAWTTTHGRTDWTIRSKMGCFLFYTPPLNNSIIYLRCCLMDKSLALHSFDVYFPEKMH